MKKILMIIATIGLVALGCSKSDHEDNTDPDNPNNGNENTEAVEQLTPGTDERPDWQDPDYDNWEQTMSVMILPQEKLKPYVTENDLLCAQMNGEVRGLTEPVIEEDMIFYPLTVGADGAEARVFLHYYCDKLHRIFSLDWADFNPSVVPTGESSFYRPLFVK